MGLAIGSRRALLGRVAKKIFKWNLDKATFTPAMAIRNVNFYGPIIQGDWDGAGVPDVVSFPRGNLLGNQTQVVYANFDPYQGSIAFLITPEWDGDDGVLHYIFDGGTAADFLIYKSAASALTVVVEGPVISTDVSTWTAGTTYCVIVRWDAKNTIDGTNYACISIDDVHDFEGTQPTASAPSTPIYLGSTGSTRGANAAIELPHIFNRPLFDGTYGIDVGNGDEIALIYGGGTFVDPMIITKGIGAVVGIPTDCGTAFDTGTDHMWSWPRGSNIPDVYDCWDGGLPGTPYAIEYNGTTTITTVTDNATIQDLMDAEVNIDIWFRADSTGESGIARLLSKLNAGLTTGWQVFVNGANVSFNIKCATTQSSAAVALPVDGKLHLLSCYFNDAGGADRKAYIAMDGVWATAGSLAVGAINSDVGNDLIIGNIASTTTTWDGGIAWVEFSDNDRHSHGTDFIPPRYPYEDGNTIEDWRMDEGTGATAAAQVTSPANDGTIANGSWSSIWNIVGTPVIPQSLQFFQENDGIDFGSGANIDDMPLADMTVEFWARIAPDAPNGTIIGKTNGATTFGWRIINFNGAIIGIWEHATDAGVTSTEILDGAWHHYTFDWDVGTLTLRNFNDGIVDDTGVAVGAYDADAAADCIVNGNGVHASGDTSFAIGWIRLSDSRRYTGTAFVPDDRVNPPGNDANAQLLVNMTDGAGTTATDTSGNGYNGTVTFGATTRWNNTPDMEIDEPGARLNPNGYNIGSDGADDGIGTTEVVTAETDYVVFGMVNNGADGHGWPYLYIYDNTNAAQIGANYYLPRMTDVHDGAGNSATLINSNGAFTQHLVGCTLYNITDGSSTTITAVSGDGTTITGVLAGGTDDDWDAADVYLIRFPRHYSRHPFGVDFNFVFRTPAACVSVDIELRNEEGAGVIACHSLQVLESILDGGEFEAAFVGAAPPIPANWTNDGLDAGDCQAGAIVHAGAQSVQYNAGATAFEGIRESPTTTVGAYYFHSMWAYGEGSDSPRMYSVNTRMPRQVDPTLNIDQARAAASWGLLADVGRRLVGAGILPYILGAAGIGAACYADDFSIIEMDSVTITATPANQANSLEGSGIRVDGLDTLTQPIPVGYLRTSEGHIRFPWTPRHNDSDVRDFGYDFPFIAHIFGDANNLIGLFMQNNDQMRLQFNANGAGIQQTDWLTGGGAIVAGVQYMIDIVYTPIWARAYIDDILRITVTAPTGFVWPVPTTAYWACWGSGTGNTGDAIIG